MYPTTINKPVHILPSAARKTLVDSLCTRAYTAILNGESFSCASRAHAVFVASYLTLVFNTPYTWERFDDSPYHIIPV